MIVTMPWIFLYETVNIWLYYVCSKWNILKIPVVLKSLYAIMRLRIIFYSRFHDGIQLGLQSFLAWYLPHRLASAECYKNMGIAPYTHYVSRHVKGSFATTCILHCLMIKIINLSLYLLILLVLLITFIHNCLRKISDFYCFLYIVNQ